MSTLSQLRVCFAMRGSFPYVLKICSTEYEVEIILGWYFFHREYPVVSIPVPALLPSLTPMESAGVSQTLWRSLPGPICLLAFLLSFTLTLRFWYFHLYSVFSFIFYLPYIHSGSAVQCHCGSDIQVWISRFPCHLAYPRDLLREPQLIWSKAKCCLKHVVDSAGT